ncbi:DUF4430 domain-containing protein [Bacillus toyonensis]|uniref:Transcobalamin-like C-terminal domain-containing protein n=1 Tax=Bacillus toyonensis TaxID=155322 RepID=A0A2C4RAM8_9BACI|nr:DUF4430 domain-containing protein [Bacillus toyonensis]MDT3496976.1 DUF4430 domain-containing protein [Bacillus toyonensis]PGB04534.1 hypothetical protein COL93_01315 [Bacillus toyonensis]PHD74119.1 hypothetical protein COF40_02240 [Bacillus toyonensis]HDX9614076.1 DUF4430 domain-containing protein [Bacillus toyonensis]
MSKMKWFISLMLSLGLLAGCEEAAVKPEKKVEPKQEEVAKQEEPKEEVKPEEKQAEPEQKQQEEKQEQKVEEKPKEEKPQEQPEVKKEEKTQEQSATKQPEQQKAQEEKQQQPKVQEVKEEAKVVNQPKETPKQEQKVDPNKENKTIPTPPVEELKPPQPDPIPKAKQVTISVKGHEGYLLGAKKVDVQEGDTVYKVLQRTGLDVDASGSKDSIYVKGINDLYEKDIADTSGWKYRVNGAFPNRSAGVVTVKPGDTIEWVYVLK